MKVVAHNTVLGRLVVAVAALIVVLGLIIAFLIIRIGDQDTVNVGSNTTADCETVVRKALENGVAVNVAGYDAGLAQLAEDTKGSDGILCKYIQLVHLITSGSYENARDLKATISDSELQSVIDSEIFIDPMSVDVINRRLEVLRIQFDEIQQNGLNPLNTDSIPVELRGNPEGVDV